MTRSPDPRTLSAQNREVLEPDLNPIPHAVWAAVLEAFQRNYENAVDPGPPGQGEVAPDFTLYDPQHNEHRLTSYGKPVVLSFFRGGWCPACTLALKALQRRYPAITAYVGEVLGISPDPPEANRRTAKSLQLKFPLLTDTNNRVADQYGLRASIAPLLAPIYHAHGIAFPDNCERLEVPYPATFIVQADGTLAETFIEKDPSIRMDP